MVSKINPEKPVGVIGAGSFGTAIANILAENVPVQLYARNPDLLTEIKQHQTSHQVPLHSNVTGTDDLGSLARTCEIIFPIIPSANFRTMVKDLAPFLQPYHILIHGTKGFDVTLPEGTHLNALKTLSREQVHTMSEIIREETVVLRIGCLAGPNLAKEINEKKPAATVIASHFDEVIHYGQQLLKSDRFRVYSSQDLIGVELCGVLKNIIAIGAGVLHGLDQGENAKALLVSRGMMEMIYLGQALGGNIKAFIGLAGVGDLVATSNSTLSRNFTVGNRLAQGEPLAKIQASMDEVAEGVNTTKITKKLADHYRVRAPITNMIYQVLFEGLGTEEALQYLMKYPFIQDVDLF